MVKIDNVLGKKIQITNSPVYSKIGNKKDFVFDLDYENLLMSVDNLVFGLSDGVGADPQKASFYVSLYGLGCVDGGKVTLDYFNSGLDAEKKISKCDIMLFNLKRVFPHMEKEFTKEQLDEFSQLFSGTSSSKEVQVVRIAYFLKMVGQAYKNLGKLDNIGASNYIFSEMRRIIDNYEKTGKLGISNDLNNRINYFYNQKIELTDDEASKVDKIVDEYMSTLNKEVAITQLGDLKFEKKTKVR